MSLSKRNKKNLKEQRRPATNANNSPRAFSYYRSSSVTRNAGSDRVRGQAKSNKLLSSKSLRAIKNRFGGILIGMFVLVCLVLLLQLDSGNPRLKILNPDNNYQLHSQDEYRNTVTSSLRNSFSNSNKITINSREVASKLESTYPEVDGASLVLPLIGHRPIVYISLSQPALIMKSASQNIVVDNAGQALKVVDSNGKLKKFDLPVLTDTNNLSFKQGDVVLSGPSVSFIKTVLRQLETGGVQSVKMVLPAASEELHLYPKKSNYYIKFNLHENDARQQAGSYLAVRKYLKEKGISPSQYVDVRLFGRAYYK